MDKPKYNRRQAYRESALRYARSPKGKETRRLAAARRRVRINDFIVSYKLAHPCVDCGEPDPVVLDFDHVRGKKLFTVGRSSNRSGYGSFDGLKAEIEKCDVRCANCHRRVTASRRLYDTKRVEAPTIG